MTFQKGHKLATGRPKGSLNKLTKANREFLHHVLFDEEQFIRDWMELDLNGRMELRTRLASYILPKATDDNLFTEPSTPVCTQIYKSFGLEALDEPYLRYYWCYEYVRIFMNWSPDILDLLED